MTAPEARLNRSQNDERHGAPTQRSERKQRTRQRILDAAAVAFREHGLAGIGIADIMRKAGLTHGGFYAHFDTKDALVAEALAKVDQQRLSRFDEMAAGRSGGTAMLAVIDGYLTSRHREHPANGCFVAALGSELARGEGKTRRALNKSLNAWLERFVAHTSPGDEDARRQAATTAYAAMIGGMILARGATDPHQADRILADVRSFMRAALEENRPRKSMRSPRKGTRS